MSQNPHYKIVMTRMEALANAIRAGDWSDIEFQYDRVLGALLKMGKSQGGSGGGSSSPAPPAGERNS